MRQWMITLLLTILVTACGKKETVLTVIQAPRGEFVDDRAAGYRLILEEPHSVSVWFADRPDRKAGYIHTQDFLQTWYAGDNSFEKNPPNALLIVEDKEPLVVELKLLRWNRQEALFEIKLLAGERYDEAKDEGFPFDIAKEHFPEYFKSPITIIFKQDPQPESLFDKIKLI